MSETFALTSMLLGAIKSAIYTWVLH